MSDQTLYCPDDHWVSRLSQTIAGCPVDTIIVVSTPAQAYYADIVLERRRRDGSVLVLHPVFEPVDGDWEDLLTVPIERKD